MSSEGPPLNYEPDVADEIPLAGIPEEPDLEGGGFGRAETDVNPPTVSEPESENRVLHDRPEDELPPATRRRIESEIAESVARNQALDGVPQLANRGAIEGETGGSLAARERSRSPGRTFLAIADSHSCESDDLEYGRFPKFHCFFGPRPWHIEIRHRVKKTFTINLFGFDIFQLKIRRLKLWKPTVRLELQTFV